MLTLVASGMVVVNIKQFFICHVISKDRLFKVLNEFSPTCTFNGQRPCSSRDITYLICHVTLQDHVIKGSCDFMEGSSSLYVTTMLCLVAINIVVVEIFSIYNVTSRDHVFKGSCDYMDRSFSE